jgi:hypothetical protein
MAPAPSEIDPHLDDHDAVSAGAGNAAEVRRTDVRRGIAHWGVLNRSIAVALSSRDRFSSIMDPDCIAWQASGQRFDGID